MPAALVDDVGGVDTVVGKIVVIATAAREPHRTLIAASGIDCARHQRCKVGPIAAI